METHRIGQVAGLAVLGFLWAIASPAEQIDNPTYQDWARFKPGTFVTYLQSTKIEDTTEETEEMGMETRMTFTVKEVTPEKVVLEMVSVMVMAGNEMRMPPQTMVHLAKIEKIEPEGGETVEPIRLEQGSEELEVKGSKIKTSWVKTQVEQEGEKAIVTAWTSEEIPGSMVKMVTESKGDTPATTMMVLVDFKTERQ